MALDTTDLLTVVGKYVKAINTWNGYLSALETAKGDIFTVLEAENLEDLYVDLPSQFAGFQSAVSSWISSLIGEVEDLLTDEEYVLENLPISSTDVVSVLNAIYDLMVTETDTIKSSVVSLGGSDVDINFFHIDNEDGSTETGQPAVFLTRTLDGTSAPSSLVSAHTRYNNVEGQLAKTCTTYGKCTSSAVGAETIQIFGGSPFEASYTADAESPGVGPSLVNVESAGIGLTNNDFLDWSGDNPTSWSVTGGTAGTAWETYFDLALQMNTVGVTAKQQVIGLTRRTMYFVGAYFEIASSSPADTGTCKLRIEDSTGGTVHKDMGSVVATYDTDTTFRYIYGFYSPNDSVNLNDIYVAFEFDANSTSDVDIRLHRVMISPATYFNGLGFAFWNPRPSIMDAAAELNPVLVNEYGKIAVSNSNGGVFQTFFRKAFNIQLPTADSPTIADSLAT